MIVSVDSGSSYLKAQFEEDLLVEPSLVEEVSERSALKEKIKYGTKWYVAGKRAEQQKSDFREDPELGNFHGTERQHVQLAYAFEQQGAVGKYNALVMSLPYDEFANDELVSSIQKKKTFAWKNSKNEDRSISFSHVFVVPQGVGALALYRADMENKEVPRLLTLVDIGSCTTDVISVVWDDEDQTYVFKERACTSIKDISTSVFMRRLREKINEKRSFPIRIGYHELDRSIRQNKFFVQIGSEEINFKEHYFAIREKFTSELSFKLEELLGDAWRASNEVVLAGGGSAYVNAWECEKRTTRMDGLANVRGQILVAKEML